MQFQFINAVVAEMREHHARDLAGMADEIARLRAELEAAKGEAEALRVDAVLLGANLRDARKGLVAADYLMKSSEGVYGLHLNGDLCPWSEIRTGGRLDSWLSDFDAAIDAERGGK